MFTSQGVPHTECGGGRFFSVLFLLTWLVADVAEAHRLRRTATMRNPENRVGIPAIAHDAKPKSPPSAEDVSQEDDMEKVDHAAREVADFGLHVFGKMPPNQPSDYHGFTCKDVCLDCVVKADEFPGCRCFATCEEGPDDTVCLAKRPGWVSYSETTPGERWGSACNRGKVDCQTCLDDKAKAEIAECSKTLQPQLCYLRLKTKYMFKESTVRYCSRADIGRASCERFDHSPEGWKCFKSEQECRTISTATDADKLKEDVLNYEKSMPESETPCVWCNVR